MAKISANLNSQCDYSPFVSFLKIELVVVQTRLVIYHDFSLKKKLLVSVVFGSNSDSLMVVVKVEEGLIQEKKTFVSKLVCRTRKPIKAASHQPAKPKNRHTEKLPYAHFHQKLRARVLFEETSKL